ncbi:MAG TPA: methyltransferase domain-containing protein [Deltaproteobacteria bacterium]|nr:methyltransferase domain-containing protein [Deltaproteobacteria bacterium]
MRDEGVTARCAPVEAPCRRGLDARERLKRSFSRAAATYERYGGLQHETALTVARMAALHAPPSPPRVLDAGCGTGWCMEAFLRRRPDALVTACDLALPMVERARSKGGAQVACDFEALPFRDDAFHMVISSLAYQWASSLDNALAEAARVLAPGGTLVFATLASGTLRELRGCYRAAEEIVGGTGRTSFMDFAAAPEVEEALRAAGFRYAELEERPVVRRYAGLIDLLRTLKQIGALAPAAAGPAGLGARRLIEETARLYKESFGDGPLPATYNVLYARARLA